MVFCNMPFVDDVKQLREVTILILIDGFLQYEKKEEKKTDIIVTILILIDGFLQSGILMKNF